MNAGEAAQISFQIQKHIAEFHQFFEREVNQAETSEKIWEKLQNGYLKINADGAFHEEERTGGYGA